MNLFLIASIGIAAAVLSFAIGTSGQVRIFLDAHALIIVIGGTIAAGSIALQLDRLALLFKIFFERVVRRKKTKYQDVIQALMVFAEAYRMGNQDLESLIQQSKDEFLKEALQTLVEGVLEDDRLIKVLKARVSTIYQHENEEVTKFKTVGKYPPAFGLMGTTLSMIALLQKLGQPGGQAAIGPAMALGLVATFWGLVFANLVFSPVAENLEEATRENRTKNLIIVEGIKLVQQKTNPVVLAEELNSFLLPKNRVDWKKLGAKRAA